LADGVVGAKPGWRKSEKDRQRAMDKIAGYDNDASLLTDLAGAKVEFASLADLYDALERLSDVRFVRFKDRFIKPQQSGYRDIQMLIRASNGHVGEFRLHLSLVDEVASWEHALFEVRRDIDAVAEEQGRPVTSVEAAIRDGILRVEQRHFYEALIASIEKGR
jgi:hypothetical protein